MVIENSIKNDPYRYVCNYYESLYPFMGRKVFSIVALMPGSLILPPIPNGSKKIKQKINLFLISNPGCQPKGSKVLMVDGFWKNIENIQVGDELISPQNDGTNSFSKVISRNNWNSPTNFQVISKNNLLYECSYNHKIPFYDYYNLKGVKLKKEEAEKLACLCNESLRKKRTFSSFPIKTFKGRKNCEIEPYTLGVWLGDGFFSSIRRQRKWYKGNKIIKINGYTRKRSGKKPNETVYIETHNRINNNKNIYKGNWINRKLGITSANEEIINEVAKYYNIIRVDQQKNNKSKNYSFSVLGELSKLLTKYGLEGKGSGEKFIPKDALLSDFNYRKKLLAGLIDTDGTLGKESSHSITTKSKKLANGIVDLVFSLGCRAKIRLTRNKVYGIYYVVVMYLRDLNIPLKLDYKKNKTKDYWQNQSNTFTIKLKEKKGTKVYGIEVDSPSHNYITDNWMVTGNSGKTSLAEAFEKICYNPIFSESMTPAYLSWELQGKDQVTIITSDVAQSLTNEEFVKILEQILGDEGSISRLTMKSKEARRKVDTIAYLSGTPNLISNDRIRDGLLFRCCPLVVTHSIEEHEKILESVNSNMGEEKDEHNFEHIAEFYDDLKKIQDGTHETFNPIVGYIIPKEYKEDLLRYIKPKVRASFEEFGVNAVRQLQEAYRFMVSHAFLNIYNRTIKDNKLVITEDDLKVAKYLIGMEIDTIFHIVNALTELNSRGIKTYKQLRDWQDKDRMQQKRVSREQNFLMKGAVK